MNLTFYFSQEPRMALHFRPFHLMCGHFCNLNCHMQAGCVTVWLTTICFIFPLSNSAHISLDLLIHSYYIIFRLQHRNNLGILLCKIKLRSSIDQSLFSSPKSLFSLLWTVTGTNQSLTEYSFLVSPRKINPNIDQRFCHLKVSGDWNEH